MLTKREVIDHCREVFKDNPDTFKGDSVAQSQYFNDYTDMLCTDGMITQRQYNTWVNPF